MLDFDTAQDRLIQAAVRPTHSERIPVVQALGRVLAENIQAAIAIPPANNSAMDGYAVRLADVQLGKGLPIQQRCYAGDLPEALQPRQAIRLFTGSLMPAGADTVIIQEHCSEENDVLFVEKAPALHANIRLKGEDMAAGKTIILKGKPLNSGHIAMLAAQGITEVAVYPIPKIGILTTGNELTQPGEPLKEGHIYNSNAPMLAAMTQQLLHAPVHKMLHANDTLADIQAALTTLSRECDVVLSVGGVSVGDKDLVKPAIEALGGTVNLWKVKMKPGKPVALAHIGNTPVIGLPGNPVSASVVFTLMVSPMLRVIQGRRHAMPRILYGKIETDKALHGGRGDREDFIRVQARPESDGSLHLTPHAQQGSAIISALAWATGLARIPANTTISNGDIVAYYDFRHWSF